MAVTINASTTAGLVQTADTSGVLQLQTNSGTTAVTIDTSQNVGIGTTSPSSKFNVLNTSSSNNYLSVDIQNTAATSTTAFNNRLLRVASNASGADATIQFTDFTAYNAYIGLNGGNLLFGTNGPTERMRIDSSGNLLVGSTSSLSSSLITGFKINNPCLGLQRGGTDGQIVVFGRASDGTIVGNITTTSSTTAYNTSSDYRLKENVTPMVGALDKVALLKPITYKWKVDGSSGEGFIAHELAEVIPDCVSGEKDAVDEEGKPVYQGVDTSFLVATLTAAIQEQQTLIVSQSELITNLTARVTALEAK